MKLVELYNLRETFWKLNRSSLVVFKKLMEDPGEGNSLRNQPDKLLEDTDQFLRLLLKETTDPELIEDIKFRLEIVAKQRCTPFANL